MRLLFFCLYLLSCGVRHDGNIKVTGGTDHNASIDEKFCDKETFPTKDERQNCKLRLLDAMNSECEPKP